MLSSNYFDSINTMPLFNWRKCQDEGMFQFCRINLDENDGRKVNDKKDQLAWEKIFDSYITIIGLGKEFERIMELRMEIANLECDYAIEGIEYVRNEINMLKAELEELLGRPVSGDSDTCLIHLSKWMGYRIDPKETTVKEFYKMLGEYQKEVERMNKKAS